MKKRSLRIFLVVTFILSSWGLMPWPGYHPALGQETGTITTVAGGLGSGAGTMIGQIPAAVAVQGPYVYIADYNAYVIRRLNTVTGNEVVVAGNGNRGYSGDGGPAINAQLNFNNYPSGVGVAVDEEGNIYIADMYNHRIRKVDTNGIISTVAGNGTSGFSGDGLSATAAQLDFPSGVAVDGRGNLYIADRNNYRIRKLDTSGNISTMAGNGTSGYSGDNGPAAEAQLSSPAGVAIDGIGNLYIADLYNHRIRKVDTSGNISTVAGNGITGFSGDGLSATAAQLNSPSGVAVDGEGNLYIADLYNRRIRKVDAGGNISTVAGNGTWGYSGDGGPATAAQFNTPAGVAVDESGNLYIADYSGKCLRKVDAGGVISTVAGNVSAGYSGGDGGPATDAQLYKPSDVAVDGAGNLYIADTANRRIRKVATNGVISTVAGNGTYGFSEDGGPAIGTSIYEPASVAVDDMGNIYISENDRIRKVDANGIISTVVQLYNSHGLAMDGAGNLFIADTENNRIRKVDTSGVFSTVAGKETGGYSGDGGPAVDAKLYAPAGVAVDRDGNIYFADTGNDRIRRIDVNGIISTVAGNGSKGYSGDGGTATGAQLDSPSGVAVDAALNLYFADTGNNRFRRVDPSGVISTVAGNGIAGFSGDDGVATDAQLNAPAGVAVDGAGNLFIADTGNNRLRSLALTDDTPLGIITTNLPDTNKGKDYSVYLTAGGGTEPYTWSIINDTLPAGLNLDSATGQITGTPAATGDFSLTVQVVDSTEPVNLSVSKTLTLEVNAEIARLGYWGNNSAINDVVAVNNNIYAISDNNLYVLDISNPSNPVEIGTFNSGGSQIALSGDYAIIARNDTLSFLNVSDPQNIIEEGQFQTFGYGGTGEAFIKAIYVQGNIVYGIKLTSYWYGSWTDPFLFLVDITDPKQPAEITSFYIGSGAMFSKADDLAVQGDYVYIVDSYDMGLSMIDISEPNNPVLSMWFVEVGGYESNKISVSGDFAYIYDSNLGEVNVIDLTNPEDVKKNGSFGVRVPTMDLVSKGNYVYTIANDSNNQGVLSIADITDPYNPVAVGFDDTLAGLNNLSVNNHNLFIAADGGVYIYNLYNTAPPSEIPEDLNDDGSVDLADLGILAGAYGNKDNTRYDLNNDGLVDIYDLVRVARNFS